MKIDKRLYKYIEYEMYHYDEYKKEIEQKKEEILEGSPAPPDGMPKGNATGNPTERKAMKLSMSVGFAAMEKTVKGIDKALSLLKDEHLKLFIQMYRKGRRDKYKMCDEIHISYRTFQRLRAELVTTVGRELGVLKEF